MKLGITGTQIGATEKQFQSLQMFFDSVGDRITEIHGGDCIGFDAECVMLVKETLPKVKTVGHPPKNSSKRAFLEYDELRPEDDYIPRDKNIVDETDMLLACPKGPEVLRSGTWTTIRHARRTGKYVVIIWPDGSWSE